MKPSLVFVHGINNGRKERKEMPQKICDYLGKNGLGSVFEEVAIGEWRSLGDFVGDLIDLAAPNGVRRNEAVEDIAEVMRDVICRASVRGASVVIVGHSMGQVLAAMAINRLARNEWDGARKAPVPIGLMTLGGPFGNASPFVQGYLHWVPRVLWSNSPGANHLRDWLDIWNRDDPVCADWVMGYKPFLAARSRALDWPGKPPISNPFAEHGSYFEAESTYKALGEMAMSLAIQG